MSSPTITTSIPPLPAVSLVPQVLQHLCCPSRTEALIFSLYRHSNAPITVNLCFSSTESSSLKMHLLPLRESASSSPPCPSWCGSFGVQTLSIIQHLSAVVTSGNPRVVSSSPYSECWTEFAQCQHGNDLIGQCLHCTSTDRHSTPARVWLLPAVLHPARLHFPGTHSFPARHKSLELPVRM